MEPKKKLLMRNPYRKEKFLLEEIVYAEFIIGLVVVILGLSYISVMQTMALAKERKKNVELALQCAMLKTKLDKNIFESSGR